MPIIAHSEIPEIPWRPNYRVWDIAGPKDGVTSHLSYSEAKQGSGAPMHYHEDDELIVILEGSVEVRLGNDVHVVDANHTVVVPPKVPHGFTVIGPEVARMMAFFPVANPMERTTYVEGTPPGKS